MGGLTYYPNFYDAYECYKELLRECPNLGMLPYLVLKNFYNALREPTRNYLNAAANRKFLDIPEAEGFKLLRSFLLIASIGRSRLLEIL